MISLLKHVLTASVVTAVACVNAAAQMSDLDRLNRETGPEARLTFTIPIGPETRTSKDKTRLEFGIRQYQDRSNDLNWALNPKAQIYGDDFTESRIGFTLSDDTKIMLNGEEWHALNEELGLSSKNIGLGLVTVAAVVLVAGVITLIILCEDGCYGDEG